MEQRCAYCNDFQPEAVVYCSNCRYPIAGEKLEQDRFVMRQNMIKDEIEVAEKWVKYGRIALFVVGGLTAGYPLLLFLLDRAGFESVVLLGLVSSIFFVLAALVPRAPVVCLSIGVGFYIIDLIFTIVVTNQLFTIGLVVKLFIITILGIAIFNAVRARQSRRDIFQAGSKQKAGGFDVLDAGF